MDWSPDSIQGVAFVAPGVPQPDALAIWTAFYGDSPDSFQRPSGNPNSTSMASGLRGDHQMQVQSQLGRIDLIVSPRPDPERDTPPIINDFDAVLAILVQDLTRVPDLVRPFRVAIVATFSIDVPEGGHGDALQKVTDGVPFPADASDCVYQFNRRKNSVVFPEIQINRVCTWASGQKQLITFRVGEQMGGGLPMAVKTIPIINFKADINSATGPDFDFNGKAADHIQEIAAEVGRLASDGIRALR